MSTAFGSPPAAQTVAAPQQAVLGVEGEKSERAKPRKQVERRVADGAGEASQQPGKTKKLRGSRSAEEKARDDPLPAKVLQKLSDEKHDHPPIASI